MKVGEKMKVGTTRKGRKGNYEALSRAERKRLLRHIAAYATGFCPIGEFVTWKRYGLTAAFVRGVQPQCNHCDFLLGLLVINDRELAALAFIRLQGEFECTDSVEDLRSGALRSLLCTSTAALEVFIILYYFSLKVAL